MGNSRIFHRELPKGEEEAEEKKTTITVTENKRYLAYETSAAETNINFLEREISLSLGFPVKER